MSEFIRLPEVRIEGVEKAVYMEPSLVEVDGKYRLHHITVSGVCYPSNKFVPLEHVGKRRRKAVEVELENQSLGESIDRLEAENDKLRELVKDMYRCSDPCNDCPHYNASNSGFYCGLGIGWKARRMRELGIEVSHEHD